MTVTQFLTKLRRESPKSLCRKIFHRVTAKISRTLTKIQTHLSWPVYSRLRGWKGVTTKDYGRELIISLTTYPPRIHIVHVAIRSLLMQNMKPNRIILWLAKEDFPHREQDFPQELLDLQRFGLEFGWCDNFRSHTKLVPALMAYPDADIVTADDDIYYRPNWLSILYAEHLKHPEDICAHRITKFYVDEAGNFGAVGGGYDTYPCPSYLHKVTGVGGVIYPPHVFYKDVTDANIFMKICTTNDDIWFWLMAVLNHVKVRVTEKNYFHLALATVGDTQKGPTLCSINDSGEHLFWRDFNRMLEYYPELDGILRDEYARMKKGA